MKMTLIKEKKNYIMYVSIQTKLIRVVTRNWGEHVNA